MCNPILTFSCLVKKASTNPEVTINHYIQPEMDRSNLDSVMMPVKLLNKYEQQLVKDYLKIDNNQKLPTFINENIRDILPLRKIIAGKTSKNQYYRSSQNKQ